MSNQALTLDDFPEELASSSNRQNITKKIFKFEDVEFKDLTDVQVKELIGLIAERLGMVKNS